MKQERELENEIWKHFSCNIDKIYIGLWESVCACVCSQFAVADSFSFYFFKFLCDAKFPSPSMYTHITHSIGKWRVASCACRALSFLAFWYFAYLHFDLGRFCCVYEWLKFTRFIASHFSFSFSRLIIATSFIILSLFLALLRPSDEITRFILCAHDWNNIGVSISCTRFMFPRHFSHGIQNVWQLFTKLTSIEHCFTQHWYPIALVVCTQSKSCNFIMWAPSFFFRFYFYLERTQKYYNGESLFFHLIWLTRFFLLVWTFLFTLNWMC